MKTLRTPHVVAIIVLAVMLQAGGATYAAEGMTPPAKGTPAPLSDEALKAASERIRQTGHNLQEDIQQGLRKARAQRAALEARQEADRKQDTERSRQQAARDAAAKEAKQRHALEAAQVLARKKAEESAARAERERQAAAKAQREMEEKLAREQEAAKAATDKPKLGGETKFGVDI